jgi:hypothetical protein
LSVDFELAHHLIGRLPAGSDTVAQHGDPCSKYVLGQREHFVIAGPTQFRGSQGSTGALPLIERL